MDTGCTGRHDSVGVYTIIQASFGMPVVGVAVSGAVVSRLRDDSAIGVKHV